MGKRILVVDDHPPMVKLVEDALVRAGFSVATVSDGAECLRKVAAESPDLLILDVMMPGLNGLQVLRALRQREETKDLPVIMLTARKGHGDILDGFMGGANLYLTKPCQMEELVSSVKRMLEVPVAY